jgi:tetratricopeptide (TPR) repeat protein
MENAAVLPSSEGFDPALADRSRGQWQVPLFLLGVIVLSGALIARPYAGPPSLAKQLDNELNQLRDLLSRGPNEIREALQKAQHLVERQDLPPDRAGEVRFLVGLAHIRVAELNLEGLPETHWKAARQYLEEASRGRLPEHDAGRVRYGLAKVADKLGDNVEQVAALLAASAEYADDPVEGWSLLIESYLKLPKPDLEGARKANEKLRAVLPATEEALAPAFLQEGEILLGQGKPEEARKALEKITVRAPAPLYAKARRLLARSFQDERRWSDAAALWNELLAQPKGEPGDPMRQRMLYDLGLCYRKQEMPLEAIRTWEQCLEPDSPEARAAAVQVAELQIQQGRPARVKALYEQALRDVQRPEDWKNPLLDGAAVQAGCESGIQSLARSGKYENALDLIGAYQRLAPPVKAARLKADVTADWANTFLERAAQPNEPRLREEDLATGRKLLHQAGDAYLAAAELVQGTEQSDLLWLASQTAVEALDSKRAILLLGRFLNLKSTTTDRKRLGKGWFQLGESLRKERSPQAEEAYHNSITHSVHPFDYKARFQLAQAAILLGQTDAAIEMLDQNIKLMHIEPDPETQAQTLFALSDLLFQKGRWNDAVQRLEEALSRFPKQPQTPRAHFQLGVSYMKLAMQQHVALSENGFRDEEVRRHIQELYRGWLDKACIEFENLAQFLQLPEASDRLPPEESSAIPFLAAECRFNLGDYPRALEIYMRLLDRYKGRLEALNALGGIARCYAATEQWDKLGRTLEDIRLGVKSIEDPAVRQAWEQWLNTASKPLMQ